MTTEEKADVKYESMKDRLGDAAQACKNKASELGHKTSEYAHAAYDKAAGAGHDAKEKVSDMCSSAKDQTEDKSETIGEKASEKVQEARIITGNAMEDAGSATKG